MKSRVYNVLVRLPAHCGFRLRDRPCLDGGVWPGFDRLADVVAVFYVPIWLTAAVGLLLNTRWSATLGLPAALFVFFHGCAINLGGSKMGLVPIAGGFAATALLFLGEPWKEAHARAEGPREQEPSQL